jgi:Ulp1 family protease
MLDGAQYHWRASDIARLRSPTARLNSECMNSGAALLKFILSAAPSTSASCAMCCIFSTFDLPMVRDGSLSDAMWRRTRALEYWTKAIWIIPVHRILPYEHWVLSVVQLTTGRIFLFDSLAESQHWLDDIEVRDRLVDLKRH